MFSIELLLDAVTEADVRREWVRLSEAGLPSSGGNPSPSNRPHITVAVRDRLEEESLSGVAERVPLRIELGGTLLFGHRRTFVLARQVIVTAALTDLHRAVAERIGPPEPRYANTEPDRWTPHVTLARRLDADSVGRALAVLDLPELAGTATALRMWDAAARRVTALG